MPCSDPHGCVAGQVQLELECDAQVGDQPVSWSSHVEVVADEVSTGSCILDSVGLNIYLVNEPARIGFLIPGFIGGGTYHLGGNAKIGEAEYLNIHALGTATSSSQITDADTSDLCSEGCDLEVSPTARVPVTGDWTSYRFTVTCVNPLGTDDVPCGHCELNPSSFTFDAACYGASPP